MAETVKSSAAGAIRIPHRLNIEPFCSQSTPNYVVPLRLSRWREREGAAAATMAAKVHADIGEFWNPTDDWPLSAMNGQRCRSETEAAYEHSKKPIYRLLYRFNSHMQQPFEAQAAEPGIP